MRNREIVLCRWDVGELFEKKKFCGAPIPKDALYDYCAAHIARLPFWPVEDKTI